MKQLFLLVVLICFAFTAHAFNVSDPYDEGIPIETHDVLNQNQDVVFDVQALEALEAFIMIDAPKSAAVYQFEDVEPMVLFNQDNDVVPPDMYGKTTLNDPKLLNKHFRFIFYNGNYLSC